MVGSGLDGPNSCRHGVCCTSKPTQVICRQLKKCGAQACGLTVLFQGFGLLLCGNLLTCEWLAGTGVCTD
jgi:hypothetical protein